MDLERFLHEVQTTTDTVLRRGVEALGCGVEPLSSHGKSLRPRLVYECAVALNANLRRAAALGAAIEMVHFASLCHDDVIDNARIRRGRPSLNAQVGNRLSVLLGDHLFSSAWLLVSQQLMGNGANLLAEAVVEMTGAEMRQSRHAWNLQTDLDSYLRVIEGKTATLFSACARGTALLACAPSQTIDAVSAFGRAFGMAFQIMDDLVDYLPAKDGRHKEVLKDFREGVVTLPLILALRDRDVPGRQEVQAFFDSRGSSGFDAARVSAYVLRAPVVAECRNMATRFASSGIAALCDVLPAERLTEFARESLARAA